MSASSKKEKLAVVMPVYNEQEIIETVVKDWHQTLENLQIEFVIRCYNDGSKDDTQKILNQLAKALPRVDVINKPNTGHGPTILQAYIDSSDADWTFQVDSDNEILADQFERLWELRDGFDFVLGSRSHADFPLSRQVISFFARQVIKFGFSSSIKDVNSPFRLFRNARLAPLIQQVPLNTFAPNILITGLVSAHGLKAKELPIANGQRTTGTVSIKHWKLLKVAFQSFSESIAFAVKHRFNTSSLG